MSKNTRFVYSSDGSHKNICDKCHESPCQCKTISIINPAETTIKIRVEKNGRGGKIVSILFNFPHNPDYFSKLAKKLKNHCGTGGTYKNDQIEIQGDHRIKLMEYLKKLNFKVVLAGG